MGYTGEQKRQYQIQWLSRRRDEWLRANGPCASCGSWDDLEVDHIDRATKEFEPTQVWSRRADVRDAELAKCQVLCGECHAAKTKAEWIDLSTAEHGTRARYDSRTRPCRCDSCRAAKAAHMRDWRRRLRLSLTSTVQDGASA